MRLPKLKVLDCIGLLSLAFWLAMMGAVYVRYTGLGRGILAKPVTGKLYELPADEWLSVFMKGEKIGYVHSVRQPVQEGYMLIQEAHLNLPILKMVHEVFTNVTCLVNSDFSLRYFEFSLDAGIASFKAKGEVAGRKIDLTIMTGDRTSKKKIQLSDTPHFDLNLLPSIIMRNPKKGDEFSMTMFDPQSMSNRGALIKVLGYEKFWSLGKQVLALHIAQSYEGLEGVEFHAWADPEGNVLRLEAPLGMTLERDTMENATSSSGKSPEDLLVALSIAPSKEIAGAKDASRLRVKLGGAPLAGLDLDDGEGGRQRLEGDVLTVLREDPKARDGYAAKAPDGKFLAPEVLIQSDDAGIVAKVQEIARPAKSPAGKASLVNGWVYENIDKMNVVGIPSAVEVLKTRTGDCNEHSTLAVALLRAAGVPARIAAGIVYLDGRFYYHAWVEFWDGAGWITMDPTWGQLPADATHIRFLSGGLGEQLKLLGVMGRLTIEVLESG